MATLGDKSASKTSNNEHILFCCTFCDYKCSKKFNLDRHLLSSKHVQVTKGYNGDTLMSKNEQNEEKYTCQNCCKEYSSRNGLWRHKKKCMVPEKKIEEPTDKQLIMMLHRPERKMRQNAVMICISYNYVSSNLLNVPL
jgi:hypothetical protein